MKRTVLQFCIDLWHFLIKGSSSIRGWLLRIFRGIYLLFVSLNNIFPLEIRDFLVLKQHLFCFSGDTNFELMGKKPKWASQVVYVDQEDDKEIYQETVCFLRNCNYSEVVTPLRKVLGPIIFHVWDPWNLVALAFDIGISGVSHGISFLVYVRCD